MHKFDLVRRFTNYCIICLRIDETNFTNNNKIAIGVYTFQYRHGS